MNAIAHLFAAADAATAKVHQADRLAMLRHAARPRCGGCTKWMKSSACPRERNVNGQHKGPSADDAPCTAFVPTGDHIAALTAYRGALQPSTPEPKL